MIIPAIRDYIHVEREEIEPKDEGREVEIQPTVEQAFACVRVCQMLSSYYQDIQFFRYDPLSKLVYIIAKARDEGEIEVFIPPSGIWRFEEDEV